MLMNGKPFSRNSPTRLVPNRNKPQNHVVLLCRVDQFVGRVHEFRRRVHIRELVLFVQTHGHAQVILAEEQNIDARHGCNFIDVLDAIRSLDLQGANDVIVRIAGVTQQALRVHTALRKIHGSSSRRRVPATAYIPAGLRPQC